MISQRARGGLRRRWAGLTRDRERGFSTLEATLVIPIVVIVTMLVVQFVMLWHARNVAEAAARDGLRVARGYQGSGAQGQAAASEYLDNVAGRLLPQRSCTADRTPTMVVVTVHGTVMSVIPFGRFSVTETASGPVEKFTGGG